MDHTIVLLLINGTEDYVCISENGIRYDTERKHVVRLDDRAIAREEAAVSQWNRILMDII